MRLPEWLKRHGVFAAAVGAATVYFLFAPLSGLLYHDFGAGGYVVLHSILEAVSILVAFMCFGITWHSHGLSRFPQNLLLGVTLLTVGVIDVFHTLSYAGMPDFVTPNTVNKATQMWIAGRVVAAAGFLGAASIRPDARGPLMRPYPLLALGLGTALLSFIFVVLAPDGLPAMFVPGKGLTPLKVGIEYAIVAVEGLAAYLFYRQYRRSGKDHLLYVVGAMALCMFSELFFTLYASPYDIYNLMGHVYKVGAYFFIYLMLFVTSIEEPYAELANAKEVLRQYTYHLEEKVMERTSELEARKAELERLGRLKTEFLAMCSHDMKTPLHGTMLLTEVLLDGLDGPLTDEQRTTVEAIRKNEAELLMLITNLLDLARQEQGEMRLNTASVDVMGFARSWAAGHELVMKKKGFEFTMDTGDEKGPLVAKLDAFKVQQVLNNLVSNAVKFTPEGGEIRLSVHAVGDGGVRLCMFNSGEAIPGRMLERIFERYVQADGAHRAGGGVGLGLSIARGIVELHGGRIWAESEEGVGNRICFTLPAG